MKFILSIDGGGVRGVIPATILAALEARLGLRVADIFDLIAGTSTGGILATFFATPDQDGRPAYSAAMGANLYHTHRDEMFYRSAWRSLFSLAGLTDERYDARSLERVLYRYLDNRTLDQATTRLLITSYDLEARKPYFFKSWTEEAKGVALAQAARATSAAPTFFCPLRITIGGQTRTLVDGGVFANNPAMCAYAEARRLWPDEPLCLVSLGTGEMTQPIPYHDAKNWGLAEWAMPILKVVFDGVNDTVDYQLKQFLPDGYFRFQKQLERACEGLDDVDKDNLAALRFEAQRLIEVERDAFDRMCDQLDQGRRLSLSPAA